MLRKNFFMIMVVCMFGLVAAVGVLGSGNAAEPGAAADAYRGTEQLAFEISFRQATGLSADEAYVKSVDAQYPIDQRWGLALTPDEQAYLNKDEDVRANLGTIDEYAAKNAPDTYAGLYRADERLVYVGFTKDAEQHLDNLKAQFKYPELLRLFPATYTEAQLHETVAKITADMPALSEQGTIIHLVAPKISENRVDVIVASADPDTVALLSSRYGPQLNITAGSGFVPETDRWSDPLPWKGGTKIRLSGGQEWQYCSDAFVGRYYYGGVYYFSLFTAGHCFNLWSWVYHWDDSNPYYRGQVTARSWPAAGGSADADSALVYLGTRQPYSDYYSNLIYMNDPPQTPLYEDIRGFQHADELHPPGQVPPDPYAGEEHVGDWVYKSSVKTGLNAGSIVTIDDTVHYIYADGDRYLVHARTANYKTDFGDSGGAVAWDHKAIGIHSGFDDDEPHDSVYTHIEYTINKWGVYPYIIIP